MNSQYSPPKAQQILEQHLAILEEEYGQPLLDIKHLQNLQKKRKAVEERMELRKQEVGQHLDMQKKKVEKTIQFLVEERANFEKRNDAFLQDMRKNIEKFHRELSKVYAADESLRERRANYIEFARKNHPKLAHILEQRDRETRQQLVERLGEKVGSDFDEIVRMEEENRQLQMQMQVEQKKYEFNNKYKNLLQGGGGGGGGGSGSGGDASNQSRSLSHNKGVLNTSHVPGAADGRPITFSEGSSQIDSFLMKQNDDKKQVSGIYWQANQ